MKQEVQFRLLWKSLRKYEFYCNGTKETVTEKVILQWIIKLQDKEETIQFGRYNKLTLDPIPRAQILEYCELIITETYGKI